MLILKKNRRLFFPLFVIIFLFFGANFVFALEMTYPVLTSIGLPDINQKGTEITAYVKYFFGLGVYLTGVLSLISFTIGAIGLINPNVEAHGQAKERMKGSVLGLGLTLASFIIMNTINPALIKPTIDPLKEIPGVYYWNESEKKTENVGYFVSDVSKRPIGFNEIIFKCPASAGTSVRDLLIWEFPKAGLEAKNGDLSQVTMKKIKCGEKASISSLGSFKLKFETPGVYYCLGGCNGEVCSGYMSNVKTRSEGTINDPFRGKIKGIVISNDPETSTAYGAILHKKSSLSSGGMCSYPILAEQCNTIDERSEDIGDIGAFAVDIFNLNIASSNSGSGDGVTFYSKPWGWNTGANAGFFEVSASDAAVNYEFNPTTNFVWDGVAVSNGYKVKCSNFQKCPGSIKIKGSYIVSLYSGSRYCQTFVSDVSNLDEQPFVATGSELETVFVYATR